MSFSPSRSRVSTGIADFFAGAVRLPVAVDLLGRPRNRGPGIFGLACLRPPPVRPSGRGRGIVAPRGRQAFPRARARSSSQEDHSVREKPHMPMQTLAGRADLGQCRAVVARKPGCDHLGKLAVGEDCPPVDSTATARPAGQSRCSRARNEHMKVPLTSIRGHVVRVKPSA